MRAIILLACCLAAVTAVPSLRIAGGSLTTIDNYPTMAVILHARDYVNFGHVCGGSILTNRAIITAAHCTFHDSRQSTRFRLGSTFANSGGIVYSVSNVIVHPDYGSFYLDSDIAILHTNSIIVFTNLIQPGFYAGNLYRVPDNQPVWAAGWGATTTVGDWSEQLKHVQLWTHNRQQCKEQFNNIVTDTMICVVPRTDGDGQCSGDSGSPIYHDGVIIGVLSFGGECGSRDPTVSIHVPDFIDWIQANS